MVVGQSSRVQYLSTNVVENIHRPSTDAASEASSFEPRGEARVSKKVSSEKTLLPNHARKKAETLRDATGPRAWTRPRSGAERSARRAARARAGNARVSSESPRDRERRSIRAHRAFPAPRGSRHARRHRNCRRRRPRGCIRAERKTIAAVSRSRELSYLCLAGLLGFLALLAQLLLLLEHLGVHQRERFLLGVRQVRGDPALGGVRLALGLRVSDRSGRER